MKKSTELSERIYLSITKHNFIIKSLPKGLQISPFP